MNINQKLLAYTSRMPCKQININGIGYVQRYYAGHTKCGQWDYWLHRYLSSDGDRHLHNHQWMACSMVLNGAVTEEMESGILTRSAVPGAYQAMYDMMTTGRPHPSGYKIYPNTWHRIASVEPETWTFMTVNAARTGKWAFMEDDGTVVEMEGSPRDWWRGYGCRGENQGDVL